MKVRNAVIDRLRRMIESPGGRVFDEFTSEENREVERMIGLGLLNREAFDSFCPKAASPGGSGVYK
jgi:hypothetical protein